MNYPDFSSLIFDHTQHPSIEVPDGDVWFFGYGSLMWRPEFDYLESVSARLFGYHRALCLWSIEYRGDIDQPGLVLGLDNGGSCLGRAFRICETQIDSILPLLNKREMITGAYQSIIKPIYLASGEKVTAVSLIARHGHPQYVTPPLSDKRTAYIVRKAKGKMGANIDYVQNTICHLRELGIQDVTLERIAKKLVPYG